MTFRELGLSAPILAALEEMGYEAPSPIQEKAIPPALEGRDVLGCAQTGTGKTCAFATPILQRLNKPAAGHPIRALILTPTRELAIQIAESFEVYGKNMTLRTTVIFGGVSQVPQVEKLRRGVDVLVATPGRLGDLYQQKLIDLSKLEIFVLDEADRMLDMGFIHDVKKILKWLPAKKQTMLFSATMPTEITNLVNSLLHNPARVAVNPVSSPVDAITQSVYFVDKGNKTNLLAKLVKDLKVKNALIFTRTKHGANKVARDLSKAGISAAAIHGNKSQTARQQALAEFKAGSLQCLVATDIAARGLDIEELSHVFNYNLPEVAETYVHRIGRTGRAGREGEAIAFCDFGEKPLLKEVEKLMGRSVPVVEGHPWPMRVFEAPVKDRNGRVVNAEDAEARAAAKERRRLRDAENRAASQVKKEKANEAVVAAPAQPRREKKKPQPTQTVAEKLAASSPSKPQTGDRPRGRGVRAGALIETGDAMPRTEFKRLNPFEGDTIMDATARLLAPRRTSQPAAAPQTPSAGQSSQRSKRKPAAPKAQPEKPVEQKKATAKAPAKAPAARKSVGKPAPTQQTRRDVAPKNKQGNRRGPRGPMEPNRAANETKDSTEQNTLMKPYYLDLK